MTKFVFSLLLLFSSSLLTAQSIFEKEKPKLVVGIVVDQMRYEYLERFYRHYGEDGFKKLLREGYSVNNGHYNYNPTYTGPGHASVYTGTTPAMHGIISNDWYDKDLDNYVNCVEDTAQSLIGEIGGKGKVSPRRLLTTTLSDELQNSTLFQSKTIGISLKDRGAVLPAGRTATAAYWYNPSTGGFNSSTYYFKEKLPDWVINFNNKKLADQYLSQPWNTLKPIETYKESDPDLSRYESRLPAKKDNAFPYDLAEIKAKTGRGYSMMMATPFGNSIVTEMAKAAIDAEKLGQNSVTDLLAISYSATDVGGHTFGPYSKEIQDFYIRLDQDIAQLLAHLDLRVGKGNYTLFLTADHAVLDVPQRIIDKKMAGGYFSKDGISEMLNAHLVKKFGKGNYIESISNMQVFFNHEQIRSRKLELNKVQDEVAMLLQNYPGVAEVYPAWMINAMDYNAGGLKGMLVRGYHQNRSGDVLFALQAGWMSGKGPSGTTHGSGYNYDTHVPILFFGKHIPHGETFKRYNIIDIAPTISALLNIPYPSGCTGVPIEEILSK